MQQNEEARVGWRPQRSGVKPVETLPSSLPRAVPVLTAATLAAVL